MNDFTKPSAPPKEAAPLKANLPSWETPTYLQHNEFPLEEKKEEAPSSKKNTAEKKHPKKASSSKDKKRLPAYSDTEEEGYVRRSPVRSWFHTLMIMDIPLIGWIYLLIMAFSKKDQRRDFAKAYLIYKLVFLLLALAIIAICLYVGMEAADRLLQYINML